MRGNKFRVWDKFTQTYPFIGYHVIGEVTVFNGIEQHIRETMPERREWHIETLKKEGKYKENHYIGTIDFWNHFVEEQFTGLHDKNGKEIYEGDIIVIDNQYPFYDEGKLNYIGIVEWVFAGWQVVLKIVNNDKRGISDGMNEGYLEDSEYYTVIGNIHENPELLNEVEK